LSFREPSRTLICLAPPTNSPRSKRPLTSCHREASIFDRLIDWKSTLKGCFAVAETRRRATLRNPVKSAIIASDIVRFGFARMFQTLNDNPQIVVAIFGDDESASQWLRLAGVRPPDVAWHPNR
jgi:hypothetical protein